MQAKVSGNAQVLVHFSLLFGFYLVYDGAVPSFQAHLCCSDRKLSNGAKIAATYLVFTIHILRNSCKWCAIIIV